MTRSYNFSAGPAMLPEAVIKRAQQEMLEWNNSGMSVMEMSHRGKDFMSIAAKAEKDLRDVMSIPDNYKVLFLQGGASSQFAAIPLNLLGDKDSADYLNTGMWSKKAIAEAKRYCTVNLAADTSDNGFTTVPTQAELKLNPDAAYVHYTPNETIGGVEFDYIPETGGVPLIADMSSTILSRPIDVSKFAMIYAGAQKNIGPAGLTIVIIRDDLLGKTAESTPAMFNYATHANAVTRCTIRRRPMAGIWQVWYSSGSKSRAVWRHWVKSTSARLRRFMQLLMAQIFMAARWLRMAAPG